MVILGSRYSSEDDGVVTQRHLDGDWRPRWLRQVLAEQHEQRENVPSAQGGPSRHQVATLSRCWPYSLLGAKI
jgi:hypothetical protein